jgi:hypothetical protein
MQHEDNVFALAYERALSLIQEEEAATGPTNRAIIKDCEQRRHEIETAISECDNAIKRLRSRSYYLPPLPDSELMAWADAVLAMPNLRFLVIDTTGVDNEAEVIRLLVMDSDGETTFDHLVRPARHSLPEAANTLHTGIPPEAFGDSYGLHTLWPGFSEAVRGHLVISYGRKFITEHLDADAVRHDLEPLHIIGADLQEKARHFFEPTRYYPLKLSAVCERIGYLLPNTPSALERAQAQLAILKAMAEGNTGAKAVRRPAQSDEDEEGVF